MNVGLVFSLAMVGIAAVGFAVFFIVWGWIGFRMMKGDE